MLSVGSLFSGIGGIDLGFKLAGFRTAWMCEIDKHARRILEKQFECRQIFSDVKLVDGKNLHQVDVVAFGSPCQDLSRAGIGKGLAGERSGLFYEATRIIRQLQQCGAGPRFAVWENVPGALTSNDGEDFACVLQEFLDIGATDIAWRVLDSAGFGVPQRRRRVFVVADFGGECSAEILGVSQSSTGNPAPTRKQKRKGSDSADRCIANDGRWWDGSNISDCLDVSMLTKGQMLPEKRRFPCVYEPDDGWRKVIFSSECDDDGICPACGIDFGDCLCFGPTMDGVEYNERPDGLFARAEVRRPDAERLRRLTPIEVERCFGFPDGWTEGQSDIQRYKQLGNSVVVGVARFIATGIGRAMR